MKTFQTFVVTLLSLSLVLVTFPASADTISECKGLITNVHGDLDDVNISGGNPDQTRAGLERKLDGAYYKLDEYKAEDAIQKLTQFREKVLDLIAEVKISESDSLPDYTVVFPDDLVTGVQGAIDCADGLIDQALEQEPTPAAKGKPAKQSEPVATTTEETTTVLEPAPDATLDTTTASEPTTTVKKKTSMQ